jgi:hypothetical protein
MAHARGGRLFLRYQFRYLKNRKHLAGADSIPNIDVNFADVTRHLGMQFHFLIRQELASDGESV